MVAGRRESEPLQQSLLRLGGVGERIGGGQFVPKRIPLLSVFQIVGGFELRIAHAVGHEEQGGEIVDQPETQSTIERGGVAEHFGHGEETSLPAVFPFVGFAHQIDRVGRGVATIECDGAVAHPERADKPTKREMFGDAEQQGGGIRARFLPLQAGFLCDGLPRLVGCMAKQGVKAVAHRFALVRFVRNGAQGLDVCFKAVSIRFVVEAFATNSHRLFTSQACPLAGIACRTRPVGHGQHLPAVDRSEPESVVARFSFLRMAATSQTGGYDVFLFAVERCKFDRLVFVSVSRFRHLIPVDGLVSPQRIDGGNDDQLEFLFPFVSSTGRPVDFETILCRERELRRRRLSVLAECRKIGRAGDRKFVFVDFYLQAVLTFVHSGDAGQDETGAITRGQRDFAPVILLFEGIGETDVPRNAVNGTIELHELPDRGIFHKILC